MGVGAWVAICIVVGVVGAVVTFLLTTWGFLPKQRNLPELPATAETFLPARGIRSVDVENLRSMRKSGVMIAVKWTGHWPKLPPSSPVSKAVARPLTSKNSS